MEVKGKARGKGRKKNESTKIKPKNELTGIKVVGVDPAFLLLRCWNGKWSNAGEYVVNDSAFRKIFDHALVFRREARVPVDFAEIQLETAVALFRCRF